MRPGWPGPGCCASRPRPSWRMSSSRCTRAPSSTTACEVGGLRYNGPALDAYRNAEQPLRRPVRRASGRSRINPDDVRLGLVPGPGRRLLAPAGLGARRRAGHAVQRRGRPVRPPARRPPRPLARHRSGRWPSCWPGGTRAWSPDGGSAGWRSGWPPSAPPLPGDPRGREAARSQHVWCPQLRPTGTRGGGCWRRGDGRRMTTIPEEISGDPGDDDFYADAFEVLE